MSAAPEAAAGIVVGVPRETQPGEHRVALVPEVAAKFAAAGAKVIIERGAGVSRAVPRRALQERRVRRRRGRRLRARRPAAQGAAAHARRGRDGALGRRARRLHAGAQQPAGREGAPRPQRHELRDGARAAHLARPVDGRAVLAGRHRRLQGGADRRQHARPLLPDADHRRGHDPPGAGAGDRRRRRGPAGDRDRQAPRRHRRGLRRRSATRDQVKSLGAKFVETGVTAEGAGGYARELTAEEKQQAAGGARRPHRGRRRRRHDRRRPRPGGAEDHLAGRGRAHEGRRGDRRHRLPRTAATAS